MGAEMISVWGTWEELVLGGAVLRHGTHDWNAVASELRARTHFPDSFTAKVCKAKYEELQQHYSGCTALFEELRKQRMADLKRSLEQSDDSIGSLQSKLRSLEAEKGDNDVNVDCGSNQTESPLPVQKSEGVESWGKEASKDGLSAGSFTQETQKNPASTSAREVEEMESKPDISESSEQGNFSSMETRSEMVQGGQGGSIRKRRGKRRRKECNREVKEGSVAESDFLGLADLVTASRCKENSTRECGPIFRSSVVSICNPSSSMEQSDDLLGIFDFVMNNENASSFRRRHDSQKRARYKNLIRQHMDFDTLKSRIANCCVQSARELFRDLLLLTNNALVFYSKTTREHKSALLLRDHISKILRQHHDLESGHKAAAAVLSSSPKRNPPGKPRSARPRNRRLTGKLAANAGNVISRMSLGGEKSSKADSHPLAETLTLSKKGSYQPGKGKRVVARRRTDTPMKEIKRARQR